MLCVGLLLLLLLCTDTALHYGYFMYKHAVSLTVLLPTQTSVAMPQTNTSDTPSFLTISSRHVLLSLALSKNAEYESISGMTPLRMICPVGWTWAGTWSTAGSQDYKDTAHLQVFVKLSSPGLLDTVARPESLLHLRRPSKHHRVVDIAFISLLDLGPITISQWLSAGESKVYTQITSSIFAWIKIECFPPCCPGGVFSGGRCLWKRRDPKQFTLSFWGKYFTFCDNLPPIFFKKLLASFGITLICSKPFFPLQKVKKSVIMSSDLPSAHT